MLSKKQLFLSHLGQTSEAPMLLEISSADGVFMYGPDGKKYLDLISGVSVSNTGHCHPRVVEAVRKQAGSYMHLMVYGELVQSPQVDYAARLASLLPPSLSSCYFVNSGSEAVEGALKLSKRYTGRSKIISFRDAYHGSTHGALSVQGREVYRNAFRPLLPDTWMMEYNNFSDLTMIDRSTAAVIIEPVQGEGGVRIASESFLQLLRQKCDEHGALLIFDEVQSGFGRTGTLFAFMRYGILPDILVLGKALGGGMPLGAFISSTGIMSSLTKNPALGHITTFGGHPVCCAAGLASLEVIIGDKLVEQSSAKSELFRQHLKHPLIREVRGEGLLLAVELTDSRYVSHIVANAPAYGIILDYFLFCGNAFRIAPPLTISIEEIRGACSAILKLLDDTAENVHL